MLYQLDLLLSVSDIDLSIKDRNDNIVVFTTTTIGELTKLSMKISLPNKIIITISKNINTGVAKLVSASLGNIQFNKDSMEKIFVYYHEYGLNRSTNWEFNGKVEFNFFDQTPIKYHLNMGTTI